MQTTCRELEQLSTVHVGKITITNRIPPLWVSEVRCKLWLAKNLRSVTGDAARESEARLAGLAALKRPEPLALVDFP